MTNRELATILQQTKNERRGGTPHDVWVKRNRDILLMQVRNTTDVHAKTSFVDAARHLFSIFMPVEGIMTVAHGIGIFMLVVGTVLGGGLASAQVYRGAAPGEMLYKVKLAVERAQLILAPNEDYKAGLHAEFADRRIDETAKLAEESFARQALVPGVLTSFNEEVTSLAAGLEVMKATDPNGVVETAKLMERKMAVYQNELRKAGTTLSPEYQSSIAASRDLVDGTTLKAIAVIVDKHLADSSSVSRTVVVTKFEERLLQAEANLDANPAADAEAKTSTTSKAKAAIAEAKQLVKDEDYRAALSKIEEVAQLTKEVEAEKAAEPTVTEPTTNTSTTEEGEATSAETKPTETTQTAP